MVHPQTEKIADLRQAVEQRFGRSVNTPTEFKRLCEDIKRLTDIVISQSTLMRIWGYVNSSAKPSDTILNALAVYAGYTDFMSFATHDDQEVSINVMGSRISVCDDLSVRDRVPGAILGQRTICGGAVASHAVAAGRHVLVRAHHRGRAAVS